MFFSEYIKNPKAILSNTTLMGAGIMSFGIFISSTINYVFQIAIGRVLSIEEFGVFNSLLSLTYILSMPGNSITISIIKLVNKLKAKNEFGKLTKIYWRVSLYITIVGMLIALLIILFRVPLADYLNISDKRLFFPFAIFVGVTFLNTSARAFLQGLLRYKAFAFYSVVHSVLRLLIPIGLVFAGMKVGGVYLGMSLSLVIVFFIAAVLLKKNFEAHDNDDVSQHYKDILKFSLPVIVTQISMIALVSIDLVLVKHFFDATSAGLYASVVTIGKVLLFGTGILSTAMYPIISDAYENNTDFQKKFFGFFGVQFFIIFVGVAVFLLIPEFLTNVMFGARYLPATPLLPKFAVYIGLYSLLNFLVFFSLAIEKTKIFIIILVGFIVQVSLINLFHDSLETIISINTYVVLGSLVFTLAYIVVAFNNHVKQSIHNTARL